MSQRHKEILRLLLAGKINKEIAAELGLAEQTIKNEVAAIYQHFGIKRIRELFPIIDEVRQEIL